MPELSRDPTRTAIDLSIEDDTCPDSVLDKHENEISNIAHLHRSEPKFGKRERIRIVLSSHRQPCRIRYLFDDRRFSPEEMRTKQNAFPGGVDQRRQTNSDSLDEPVMFLK